MVGSKESEARPRAGLRFFDACTHALTFTAHRPTLGRVVDERQAIMRRTVMVSDSMLSNSMLSNRVLSNAVLLSALAFGGNAAAAISCPTAQRPVQAAGIAPVATELAPAMAPLGTPGSVLAQAYDESQSLDQVLLRIRIEACRDVAIATPAPGVVSPDDPAAYKPRTEFDNTPWRFNMNQNGRNMTADEFSAWMKSRGVRVARGAAPAVVAPAATAPATEAPPSD
jgi:hypothetical protein